MQSSVVGRTSLLSSSTAAFLPKQQLAGCQWRQKNGLVVGLDVQQKSRAAEEGRGRRGGLKVTAFFGGSKSTDIKAAGKGCFSCLGKGAIDCSGCKGTGRNKKNGNMFERWKCYDCQGFGLVGCPKCGTGGLTPEQRGER